VEGLSRQSRLLRIRSRDRQRSQILEPAFGAGDAGGVDAIGGSEFADGFGEIVSDGSFGEVEGFGDFLRGFAFAGFAEDLALAVSEGVGTAVPGFSGEVGIDDAESTMDAADGVGKLGGGTVFEEIAFGSGVECAAQIAGAREGGEDDDPGVWVAVADFGGEGEAGHSGHFDIGNEDVGPELRDGVEGLVSVGGAGADGDVGLGFKQSGERSKNHGLIFCDDDLDFRSHRLRFSSMNPL
jgi:hypothetical protein